MSLRLAHSMGALTVVLVYAFTKCGDEGDKDRFYQQLEYVFEACPAGETSLVLGTLMLYLAHCERTRECDWSSRPCRSYE